MGIVFASAFCALTALSLPAPASSLLEDARKSQSKSVQNRGKSQERDDLLKRRTEDLARVLDRIVSDLEEKGVLFERVQADGALNPLPELIKGKVGLERRRKPPRVILKPKGAEERIYLEIVWASAPQWSYAVKVSRGSDRAEQSIGGSDLRGRESLEGLAPRLKEAVLQLIAAKSE